MSISKYLLAVALSFCALGNLSAADSAKHAKKHYLDEKAISVTKDGILVKTKTGNLMARVLRSDEKGIYVLGRDILGRAKGYPYFKRFIKCRCGREFLNEGAYWRHVDSGECPYYPRR
jgi:hypothetical protein